MYKGLFLDLDNTLIETKSGKTFPTNYKDWMLREGVIEKLRGYLDYQWVIITNQAGIEKGFVQKEQFESKLKSITELIKKHTGYKKKIGVYIADSTESLLRKPFPQAAYNARDYYNLDLSQSVMIGDASGFLKIYKDNIFQGIGDEMNMDSELEYEMDYSDSDMKFAENAGIGTYYDIEIWLK